MGTIASMDESNDRGAGIASTPAASGPVTHYHATRLDDVGDVVLAVTRILDRATCTPSRIQLRALRADATERAEILTGEGPSMLDVDGALAWVDVDLQGDHVDVPWIAPSERVARVDALHLAGASPAERAGHVVTGLADWLLTVVETELLFATWFAVRGDARALSPARSGRADEDPAGALRRGDFGTWAADWLARREYAVAHELPGTFAKVVNAPLLARVESGDVG